MKVILLDGIHAETRTGSPLRLQRLQAAALFALLVSRRALTADQLRELLWEPDRQPADPKRPVKVMSALRDQFGERIVLGPLGYEFRAAAGDLVDLHGWRKLIQRADALSADDPHTAAVLYDLASGPWVGLPKGLPDTIEMRVLIDRLNREWLSAAERRIEVQLKLGRHLEFVDKLPDLVREAPEREHLVELLIVALQRAQRSAEALTWYERLRSYLEDMFGTQPSQVLQDLHEQIRMGKAPPFQVPPLPPADQAVEGSGGDVSVVSTARMSSYLTQIGVGGYREPRDYHTAKDRAGVEALLAVAPEVRGVQAEAVDFTAQLARQLALLGITQFIELGALTPSRLVIHEVARLPRPSTRVVYCNSDAALVRFSQDLFADVDGVSYICANLRSIMTNPYGTSLIDWSKPVCVVNQQEINTVAKSREDAALFAELGELLAPGSYVTVTAAASEGMAPAVPWTLAGINASHPTEVMVTRTRAEVASLVPPGFELLPPGVTHTSAVWETWTGRHAPEELLPGPLPRWTFVAVKT